MALSCWNCNTQKYETDENKMEKSRNKSAKLCIFGIVGHFWLYVPPCKGSSHSLHWSSSSMWKYWGSCFFHQDRSLKRLQELQEHEEQAQYHQRTTADRLQTWNSKALVRFHIVWTATKPHEIWFFPRGSKPRAEVDLIGFRSGFSVCDLNAEAPVHVIR